MTKQQKWGIYTRIIVITTSCLFGLLMLMESLPLFPNNTLDSFRLLGQQRSLSLRIIKDCLILAYRPAGEHAEALDELQKSIGPWEQTQNQFYNSTRLPGATLALPNDSLPFVQQSEYDFSSIDASARRIIAAPNQIDPLQIQIVVAHSDPYFLTISQALLSLQNSIEGAVRGYFIFELILEGCLICCVVFLMIINRQIAKEYEKHQKESSF